jgi:3-dehydroquinate dehydratase / shikimate dehydrogenase
VYAGDRKSVKNRFFLKEHNRLICIPITESVPENFLAAIREAELVADAVELRLDFLAAEGLSQVLHQLRRDIEGIGKPLILTFRPRAQGGKRNLTLQERQNFWRMLPREINEGMAFADFEIDLAESFASDSPIPWQKVICSWHSFESTPENLLEIYQRLDRTQAAVNKIATQVNRIGDCLRLLDLLENRQSAKPTIIIGMGMPGMMTRVLGLSRGAMLTFGALKRGAESASGQPTIDELVNLYRVNRLKRETEIFGVIGKPIGHSRSPFMHNSALKTVGRDGVYLPFEVDDLDEFIHGFVRPATRKIDWRLRGLSVTIPHKTAVIAHLDYLDPIATSIGAVNTIVVEGEQLHGYNTDVRGAMKPLEKLIELNSARVAVLGAGGSARAVCFGLKQRGALVSIYARNPDKAQSFAHEFGATIRPIEKFEGQADLVINCTPIGMRGHSEGQSPIVVKYLKGVKLVYDLVYNPEETTLLKGAEQAGCRTLGGLEMLAAQAAEQFYLWTGLEMPESFNTKGQRECGMRNAECGMGEE